MIFLETPLHGAYVIEVEKHEDERGFFRSLMVREGVSSKGLETKLVQCNVSFNQRKGTLRGFTIRCRLTPRRSSSDAQEELSIDVIVDLRADSPTFLKWFASGAHRVRIIGCCTFHSASPMAFRHWRTELKSSIRCRSFMLPSRRERILWNDPRLGINWPEADRTISKKDRTTFDLD